MWNLEETRSSLDIVHGGCIYWQQCLKGKKNLRHFQLIMNNNLIR